MKNTLRRINIRLANAEQIKSLGGQPKSTNQQQKEKKELKIKFKKDSLRVLWDNTKCTNVHFIGTPEGEEREKGARTLFKEIMTENFPHPGEETDVQAQEAQGVPKTINPGRPTPGHLGEWQTLKRKRQSGRKLAKNELHTKGLL